MKYCFDFKMQLVYGIITFLSALAILYMFTGEINWIAYTVVGIITFIVSGFYTKCK
jgi:hypothetical protein